MKQMKFKVTLSTDVVLNVKSATDGNNQTLDFIPGNNFLGIVAGRLYQKVDTQTAWTLFRIPELAIKVCSCIIKMIFILLIL